MNGNAPQSQVFHKNNWPRTKREAIHSTAVLAELQIIANYYDAKIVE